MLLSYFGEGCDRFIMYSAMTEYCHKGSVKKMKKNELRRSQSNKSRFKKHIVAIFDLKFKLSLSHRYRHSGE